MYKEDERLFKYPREYWEELIRQWIRDEKARYCLTRNFLDGVPYEQIASELNIVTGTVYNKMSKYAPILFDHVK